MKPINRRKSSASRPPHADPTTPTAEDVARRAGVSQSAVSRAFTPGASIAQATREKVIVAARDLGYRPNLIARSLSTRRSHVVGVAITRLTNHFHAELLQALSTKLSSMGYRVLLFLGDPDGDADPIIDEVLQHQVDAIVLASISLSSKFAEECRGASVPVVLLNRTTLSSTVSAVTGDNFHGGRTVASFLLAGQHRSFGFIAGSKQSSTSRDREQGYSSFLRQHGIDEPIRVAGNYSFDGAADAARKILALKNPPDALFCANDHMALAVMEVAAREYGLKVGKDISIVGFDDSEPAGYSFVGLTTFSQSPRRMAHQAASMIQDMLSSSSQTPIQQVIGGDLVVRQTTRIPSSGVITVDGKKIWRLEERGDR